jgi:hypothetical protein
VIPVLRRKRLPPELVPAAEAFLLVLAELEPAKVALTEALPGTRSPGRPLDDALDAFGTGLERARALMSGWRVEPLRERWNACAAGLDDALARAGRARGIEPSGFESLLWTVEELLDPLEPFADAERALRELRR